MSADCVIECTRSTLLVKNTGKMLTWSGVLLVLRSQRGCCRHFFWVDSITVMLHWQAYHKRPRDRCSVRRMQPRALSETPVLKQLHWLPINCRIQHKLCLLMLSIFIQQRPNYNTRSCVAYCWWCDERWTWSASGLSSQILRVWTILANAPSVILDRLHETLLYYLRSITNTARFKRQLITRLFALAY